MPVQIKSVAVFIYDYVLIQLASIHIGPFIIVIKSVEILFGTVDSEVTVFPGAYRRRQCPPRRRISAARIPYGTASYRVPDFFVAVPAENRLYRLKNEILNSNYNRTKTRKHQSNINNPTFVL